MEKSGDAAQTGNKLVKQASINTKLVVDQAVQLQKSSSDKDTFVQIEGVWYQKLPDQV